jgi:phage terminase small subunit
MTPKQQRFVEEYALDFNATQAAIRAGYSQNCAKQIGSENLSKPDIAQAIAAKLQEGTERAGLSVDWVLQELRDTYDHARASGQLGTAHASLVSLGKHLEMWPSKITITDADRTAARVAAAALGLDEADVLAEVERELREARS